MESKPAAPAAGRRQFASDNYSGICPEAWDALIAANNVSVNAAASGSNPNVFVVTVSYNAAGMFLFSLPFVPTPPTTIVRSAAIPYGGF